MQPGVTAPIISVTKIEQLDQLVDGLRVTLTPEQASEVEAPYRPHPIRGTD
jgi:aryl-alcohol dehydrogenase-like predicted oxidoreductase